MVEYITNEFADEAILLAIKQAMSKVQEEDKKLLIFVEDESTYKTITNCEPFKYYLSFLMDRISMAKRFQSVTFKIHSKDNKPENEYWDTVNDMVQDGSCPDIVIFIFKDFNFFKPVKKYLSWYSDTLYIIPCSDKDLAELVI